MKKTKLTVGLVTTFIATLGLSACNDFASGALAPSADGAVVTITGYNGEKVEIKADDLYGNYLKDQNKVSSFYDSVVENLIRYTYQNTSFVADNNNLPEEQRVVLLKTFGKIESEAKLAIRKAKEKAQSNAKSNGTTYAEEWAKVLTENGVETEQELEETYIYKYEKEEYERWYSATKVSSLTTEYISEGLVEQGKVAVNAKFPYHIRHILVSVDGGATNYTNGTISEKEAENLGIVMSKLVDGTKSAEGEYLYPFGAVAKAHSGDTGSGAKGGDVGIMSTSTSFVNEFKLGIYAFDALTTAAKHDDAAYLAKVQKGLGLTSEIASRYAGVVGTAVKTVPYDAFMQIGKNYDVTQTADKLEVNENNANYYPRNIYWNNYLNLHEPFLITNQKLDPKTGLIGAEKSNSERFNSDGILTDEEGRLIIGVRSEHGIHLMIMQKSIFNDETSYVAGSKKDVTLDQYYTTYTPDNIRYPGNKWKTTEEGKKVVDSSDAKTTYVNYLPGLKDEDLESRASEVNSEITSYDSTYSYRTYTDLNTYLTSKGVKVSYSEGIKDVIDNYVATLRQTNKNNRENDLENAWDSYIKLLELEKYNRTTKVGEKELWNEDGTSSTTTNTYRVINPICAVRFQKAKSDKNYTEEGGICYYAK